MKKVGRFIVIFVCSFIVFYLFFFTMSWLGSFLFHSELNLIIPALLSFLVAIYIAIMEYKNNQKINVTAEE